MKSEIWFEEKALEMARIFERPNMITPELELIKRIYTDGRRDQVEACDASVKDYEYKHREDLREGCYSHEETFDAVSNAIRAAGPGENE